MIYLIIGTKAQFIKMAPIAILMQNSGLRFIIVDLGQHSDITNTIVGQFGITAPIIRPTEATGSVSSYLAGLGWLWRHFKVLTSRSRLTSIFESSEKSIALIHGDTASTLIGLFYAKRLKMDVGLVEAGLTSGRLLDPFPEEMIRRIAERHSDMLFYPGDEPGRNLKNRNLKAVLINTKYNTGLDAMRIARSITPENGELHDFSVLCTLHRLETISSRPRLRQAIAHVLALSDILGKTLFLLHQPTLRALKKFRLMNMLESRDSVTLQPLVPYPEFIGLLEQARYVLTDGGSVQEEASYLGKPCLILRRRTERPHGLGKTAFLASFSPAEDARQLEKVAATSNQEPHGNLTASRIIVNHLITNYPFEKGEMPTRAKTSA